MLKVLPVPLLTAGHCSHQDVGVQMVEENRAEWGRTELIAHGKGRN